MSNDGAWEIDGSIARFNLDKDHVFVIEKVNSSELSESGFILKVFDKRGPSHRPDEPIIIYSHKITDSQLGWQDGE